MNTILLLLVEDEPLIADFLEPALEEAGFEVMIAESGSDAFIAIDEKIAGIGALITDVRLGDGPDGWEVARHAREAEPTIPVVYMTGDSAADWPSQGVPKSILIQKPFATGQIITAVATLLNDTASNLG